MICRLMSGGKSAQRDIVQFVPFRKFKNVRFKMYVCDNVQGVQGLHMPKKNFKEPTRPKAEKLGAQHVK